MSNKLVAFITLFILLVLGLVVYENYSARTSTYIGNQVTPTSNPYNPGSTTPTGGNSLPSGNFGQNSFGYIGCSLTHDTVYGYQQVSAKHLFWPYLQPNGGSYSIENHQVYEWADPNNRIWHQFDNMKNGYNGGKDPPIIWFELCELRLQSMPNAHITTFDDVKAALNNLKVHAPTSVVYLTPYPPYDPPSLCKLIGGTSDATLNVQNLAQQAVDAGLAKAGPGLSGTPNLGPMTAQNVAPDGCHPSGYPHGEGGGDNQLGGQLASFFDNLP